MNYIVVGLLCFIVGIAFAKLFPYIKDGKITPDEKAYVQGIIIDVIKDILLITSDIPSKNKLVLIITEKIVKTLSEENINGFSQEEIERTVSILIDKLIDVVPCEPQVKAQVLGNTTN